MKRYLGISFVAFCSLLLVAGMVVAKPAEKVDVAPVADSESFLVGDDAQPVARKALEDTIWIADWNFDSGTTCTSTGWVKYDSRIINDGSNYWAVNNSFGGTGGIVNKAAVLSRHNLCWAGDGYGANWDYSIILKYKGTGSTLNFNFLSDSEPGFDFVTVEADSAGASEARVNYSVNPQGTPEEFRTVLFSMDGLVNNGISGPISLPDFTVPATTHEAYIRFESDGGFDDEDGFYPSFWQAGLIVDNIAITGGALNYSENFEGALNANVTLTNSAAATPFGQWARTFLHITDNDKCTENTTCGWLGTDPLRIAFFSDMAFGPGSAVIRNWLDDIYVSPWVDLTGTPTTQGTVLQFRRFAGNRFAQGPIVQGWRVRAKVRQNNTDTTAPGDSIDCISPWGHASQFNSLTNFQWLTNIFDATTNFDPTATEIQFSFRNGDWQFIAGVGPPATLNPGPGPYVDRVAIGRRVLTGPVFNIGIDTRTQAQDCFPTVLNAITPGEHHSPAATDIFGTCAFSEGTELGINTPGSPNLITGDSIVCDNIVDARGLGGVNLVKWYAAIVSGPHAGKAPAPYTVGGNGFFEVQPDSSRNSSGNVVSGRWFVDLDDTYFRGGDQVKYFWWAGDAGGGRASFPLGLTALPASVAAAEAATVTPGGLMEVNYLPTINWSAAYLARIAADPNGDLDPTPAELAASSQKNCILYYQHVTANRRSTDANKTSFMYALDRLGYRTHYDVYDVQGYGNTNNQLGGRATEAQCARYALIIEDDGRSNLVPNIPNGTIRDTDKVNQALWYRNWLGQQPKPQGISTFWLIGETTVFEKSTNALFTTDMGLSNIANDQGLTVNPNVSGQASFTFTNGNVASFAGDQFALNGGCPSTRAYDVATAGGTAVLTHRYVFGTASGNGAVIMNKNTTLNWNTVWMGFGYFDIRDPYPVPAGPAPAPLTERPDIRLARKILTAALPVNCFHAPNPVDNGTDPEVDAPAVTRLHQNVPNPFNPTTKIEFDLARDGNVKLQVFDVAGHLVNTLQDAKMSRGFKQSVTWNGLDAKGTRVPSGVYFYQLVTEDYTATKKMVMLK
jgi:hypothetical protein